MDKVSYRLGPYIFGARTINIMLGNRTLQRMKILPITFSLLKGFAMPNSSGYSSTPVFSTRLLRPGGSENNTVHSIKKTAKLIPERKLAYRMPI
ncbi:hypothetical protein D3C74_398210 [compost metagenome]